MDCFSVPQQELTFLKLHGPAVTVEARLLLFDARKVKGFAFNLTSSTRHGSMFSIIWLGFIACLAPVSVLRHIINIQYCLRPRAAVRSSSWIQCQSRGNAATLHLSFGNHSHGYVQRYQIMYAWCAYLGCSFLFDCRFA